MKEILYRQLLPADLNEYRTVRLDCLRQYPNNFGTTYEEELNSQSLKLDKAIKNSNEHNFAFGAFTQDLKLIGICGFLTETRLKTQHRGEIVQMFVDPSCKGQGIGKKLLHHVIDKAFSSEQIEQIILSAVSENEQAVNLYKQAGFIEYGKLKNYFKSNTTYSTQSFFYIDKPGIG
jgi:ribosomal protein S18 acetylase RimI-like enzyme